MPVQQQRITVAIELTDGYKRDFANTIETIDVHEKSESKYAEYERHILRTIADGKKEFNKDFYIDVIWSLPKHGDGEIKHQMLAFDGIPTPHFNQSVYRYIRSADDVELIWSIPDKETCLEMYYNKDSVHPDEYPLLEQIMNYFDGTIFRKVDERDILDGHVKL